MSTRWLLLLCCAAAIPCHLHGQPIREVLIPTEHRNAAELKLSATGELVIIRRDNPVPLPAAGEQSVVVLDRHGREVFRRAPADDVPAARVVSIDDAAAGNGRLVIAVTTMNADQRMASLLLHYDMGAAALIRVVRTDPITCRRITIGETGDTWCIGANFERYNRGDHNYDVVYRYQPSGPLLRSFLPRSILPDMPKNPVRPGDMGGPLVTAVAGRISAWLPGIGVIVHWPESTERVTTTAIPTVEAANRSTEVIALEDGRVVALRPVVSAKGVDRVLWRRGFFVKDASGESLMTTNLANLAFGSWLLGADQDELVIWDRQAGRVQWLQQLPRR